MKTAEILKTLNILYAEDNPNMRETTSKMLSLFAREVISVENGTQALEQFKSNPFHIIILDYIMPIIDGNIVARQIRELNRDIPILMLSSYSDKEKLLSSIKVGVNDYLEKPIDFDSLYNALLRAVEVLIEKGKLKTTLWEGIEYDQVDKMLHTPTKSERLTKTESAFLELLLAQPNTLLSKEDIERRIFAGEVEPNALRNMVYRLRKKIPAQVIVTIKDLGYMIRRV